MRAVGPAEGWQKEKEAEKVGKSSGTDHVKTRNVIWRIKPGWDIQC